MTVWVAFQARINTGQAPCFICGPGRFHWFLTLTPSLAAFPTATLGRGDPGVFFLPASHRSGRLANGTLRLGISRV